jgi:hypothetical protein
LTELEEQKLNQQEQQQTAVLSWRTMYCKLCAIFSIKGIY